MLKWRYIVTLGTDSLMREGFSSLEEALDSLQHNLDKLSHLENPALDVFIVHYTE